MRPIFALILLSLSLAAVAFPFEKLELAEGFETGPALSQLPFAQQLGLAKYVVSTLSLNGEKCGEVLYISMEELNEDSALLRVDCIAPSASYLVAIFEDGTFPTVLKIKEEN